MTVCVLLPIQLHCKMDSCTKVKRKVTRTMFLYTNFYEVTPVSNLLDVTISPAFSNSPH